MTRKQFNAREFERELVDAGYMPLYEYIRRWGSNEEVLSSVAARSSFANVIINLPPSKWTNTPQPKANAGERANN